MGLDTVPVLSIPSSTCHQWLSCSARANPFTILYSRFNLFTLSTVNDRRLISRYFSSTLCSMHAANKSMLEAVVNGILPSMHA